MHARSRASFFLLDLPMRDGNLPDTGGDGAGQHTFRPSYEGWKHGHGGEALLLEPAFRPSYEGWKLHQ